MNVENSEISFGCSKGKMSGFLVDSATGSRESSQVGRKKDKEGTKDEAKKGRKKSGSIGVKKSESEFVVAMSKSLTGEVRTRFDQVAQKLGWDVRTDLEDDVTHLAVSLEDEKQRLTKRTVSFLKAVLKGVWIVDPQCERNNVRLFTKKNTEIN